jgi:Fe-S-cluster containining protein
MALKPEFQELIDKAKAEKQTIKKEFNKLKTKKQKDVDLEFHKRHEAVFKKIDCLDCANCCKTTSPIFRDVDIKRISKELRMKESQFISNYLKMDEDSDYVLKSSPCYFLGDDNKCSIYDVRPLACREYPHTDRKNMHQILSLTEKNTEICPAVATIVLGMIVIKG